MKTKHLILAAALLLAATHADAQYTSYTLYMPITAADFNLHGPVEEVSSYGEDPVEEAHWTYSHSFDRDGRLTEYEEWSYGGGERRLYHYSDGRLDSISLADDSTHSYGWFYTYDANGCPAMQTRRYVTIDTIRYTCDEQCRIVEEHVGRKTTRYTYTDGRIVTMTDGDAITRYEYDAHGHKTKQTTQNGNFVRTEAYTYNDHGDMTEYCQFTTNPNYDTIAIQYEYTYDTLGNWVTHSGNEFIATRTIEYFCLDTTLMQTDDSVSFDECYEIRWRNLMAVWVDSTGTLSLTHDFRNTPPPPPPPGETYEYAVWVDSTGTLSLTYDFRNTPPPPPPPGETYEYVDDRVPTDLVQLREQVKRFLANSDNVDSLPEMSIRDIPLLGERPVSKGLVSLFTLEGAPEATVDSVRHEIAAAIVELRDSLSQKLFGLHYGDLALDQAAAIRAAIPTSVYYSTINRYCKIVCYDE